ncbi:MAG TPA: hypothetical protein PKA41_05700 [Verrucomicrobiota bacterium]|nr:hypothetical protein [Verrucomicrobiota bacterium]
MRFVTIHALAFTLVAFTCGASPGVTNYSVALNNGSMFSGTLRSETATNITIAVEGRLHVLAKPDIKWVRTDVRDVNAPAYHAPLIQPSVPAMRVEVAEMATEADDKTDGLTTEEKRILKAIGNEDVSRTLDLLKSQSGNDPKRARLLEQISQLSKGKGSLNSLRANSTEVNNQLCKIDREMIGHPAVNNWMIARVALMQAVQIPPAEQTLTEQQLASHSALGNLGNAE